MFLTVDEICAAISGASGIGGGRISEVSTDSRTIAPGSLFVALRGERFDGHRYVAEAFARGAVAAVVEEAVDDSSARSIVVPDTLVAYGQIASAWRRRFPIPVVAVTGSVGKTTMKEMAALALSPMGQVLKSEKNENNEVGVPQTLLRLSDKHRAVVIEMGMRGLGQIRYLSTIALPTIGVVTMIGESHLELLGTRERIADAKGELLESLAASGTAVLNADDKFHDYLAAKTNAKIVRYGFAPDADVRVLETSATGSSWKVRVRVEGKELSLTINSPALHDVGNASGALAVAVAAGVAPENAATALDRYRPFEMRMEVLRSSNGTSIINDCYNAAPSSLKSALRTLAEFPATGAKIAVLGDMRELGTFASEMHDEVASFAASCGITEVFAVGEMMPVAFANARKSFKTSAEAATYLSSELELGPTDVVLVKGSRAIELEKVVKVLTDL